MRRSAAPSQLGSASKRARFTPPFAVKPSTTSISQNQPGSHNPALNRTKQDVLHLIQDQSTSDDVGRGPKKDHHVTSCSRKTFKTPVIKTTPGQNSQQVKLTDTAEKNKECERENNLLKVKSSPNLSEPDSSCTSNGQPQPDCSNKDSAIASQPRDSGSDVPDSKNAPLRMRATGLHRSTFRQPLLQKKRQADNQQDSSVRTMQDKASEEDGVKSHYYNVMWCKLSKKKHKKWEGDAVLITKERSVTLLDMEGKEIGKGRGYKIKDLETMCEGQTLVVGGKEIEVMGELSEAEFTSGKCFQAAAVSSSISNPVQSAPMHRVPATKPFMNPLKANGKPNTKVLSDRPILKPLFDPAVPGALVMPRPNATHQWENNHNKQTVIDVVVDPYLACKLRPHQREGVQFLYECVMGMRDFQGSGVILADDMGLGKTLQCITLIWTLYKQGPYGGRPLLKRIIVVTPGSLVKNWCREFRKWLGNERIKAFDIGSDNKVDEFAKSPIYPVMVISYEMFVRSINDIQKIKFDLVICDEGHRLKNTNIKTTSLIMSLPTRRRILLTGTPVQNDLQEFYSIVEFCNPGVLGSSGAFHRVYEEPILRSRQPGATQEEKKLGETRAIELSRLTSLFVLRRTQEINNKYLPPKVETVVFCQPAPLQLALYHKLLSSRVIRRCLTSASYVQEASPHLVCIAALKKLCNHPSLIHKACVDAEERQRQQEEEERGRSDRWNDGEEVSLYKDLLPLYPADFSRAVSSIEHSGKLQVLCRLLKAMHAGEVKERIVLVSNYTQTLDVLQKLCDMEGYQYSRLDGSTPTAKRQHIVEQFNTKYAQQTVFLLSSKAGGVGLNLVGASRLVLYDIDWNPANDLQAMARVWRDGQKKTVYIYRLITTGTLEEKVYQRQISKQGLSGAVMDAKIGAQANVKFSLEDLKDLFTLHDGATCITHDMLDCSCQDEQAATTAVQDTDQSIAPSRVCQLGKRSTQKATKNLSMDELMEWKHFAGPLDEDFQDTYLASARDFITYVFQNITNSTNNTQNE